MTTPTEQDLLDAIDAFLPKPKQPGEYTIKEIAAAKDTTERGAQQGVDAMIAKGLATVREAISANGKPIRYYRLVS